MSTNRQDRRRWWSIYLADGTRLEDVWLTAAVIRATLPGAVLDTRIGRVTLAGAGSGGVREGGESGENRPDSIDIE